METFSRRWALMILASLLLVVHYAAMPCNAAHPLITDDTGTQGKDRGQLEINIEFDFDRESVEGITVKEKVTEIASILSMGIADNMDVVLGVPYQWIRVEEDGIEASRENGLSDMSFEVKWRFFEKEGIGLALKPGITFPTGDDNRGLGTGKATYSLYFISTMETGSLDIPYKPGIHREPKQGG
ncbi:MAG: transporter [Pseudomonadota bacterium]